MKNQTEIKDEIERQRKKLDHLAKTEQDLTKLLGEARKMDLLVETYEDQKTTA